MWAHHRSPAFFALLLLSLLFFFFFFFLVAPTCSAAAVVGVNWGTASSSPLPPSVVVPDLLRANNITRVKLSDANGSVLQSLAGSGIGVVVGVPNEMLSLLSSSKKAAASWVHDNVTRYLTGVGGVRIEYIAVGDEAFLRSSGLKFQTFVVGAASNIQLALITAKLADKVKIIVPCSSDVYQTDSNLPSKGHFRKDMNKTMIELLSFLDKHGYPFVVDFNPFLAFQQTKNLSIDFFTFQSEAHKITDGHNKYTNWFDASIDSLVTSLSKAGFGNMDIVVGKIGWPSDGALNATPVIAQTFMKGIVNHFKSRAGTPLRSSKPPSETYIFSLLDEDQRSIVSGPFERHWGIFTFDGQAKYSLDLGGWKSKDLVNAHNVQYLASKWCVVNNNKDLADVSSSASDACSKADCSALSPGGSCSHISWPGNISYAFNSYFQQHDQIADSCNFNGMGLITTVDPSVDNCRFPVALSTSSSSSICHKLVVWSVTILSLSVSSHLISFLLY